ncbi:tetratricopeptide repeat protein [Terribacillus saccharophilus]|uniref:Response regulator aspartate phosphatase C n=1 Tax=Terribacillus saccharophilus TaxID=361277 RepID=A0ABX4GYJ2_9BACI|nr:tetratricopeptide repeat protein [Terribacillus saccharophilus]PAD35761.1 hypothetical protein CHH56_07550 [Terribacillus saccharophilus]PAD96368.1 hypothetical protein CHH50_09005 [Terribacillus saccharophilus]PAD99943.1 hypothetical protein CHH48_09910 [Terribacillus saccharophilus]
MGRNSTELIDIAARLENWSVSIRLDKKEAAASIHKELQRHIDEYNHESKLLYFLLESRHYIIQNDLMKSIASLEQAKDLFDYFSDTHRYHLHLAEAMIFYEEEHYQEALDSFEKAEKYLHKLSDPVDVGEFHFRKAMAYFFLEIIALSVVHTEKAIQSFKPHQPFHFLLARSEMLQGLNFIELANYDLAEEYLHNALTHARKTEEHALTSYINHNLGGLYARRGLPAAAIRYLKEAYKNKQQRTQLKVLFLLADCYWKTNQRSKATKAYNEGFQASIEEDNMKMKWEFAMLHKKYEDRLNFESVWQEGIDYFHRINDNYNVRHYTKELADYYSSKKNYELANRYYALALQ